MGVDFPDPDKGAKPTRSTAAKERPTRSTAAKERPTHVALNPNVRDQRAFADSIAAANASGQPIRHSGAHPDDPPVYDPRNRPPVAKVAHPPVLMTWARDSFVVLKAPDGSDYIGHKIGSIEVRWGSNGAKVEVVLGPNGEHVEQVILDGLLSNLSRCGMEAVPWTREPRYLRRVGSIPARTGSGEPYQRASYVLAWQSIGPAGELVHTEAGIALYRQWVWDLQAELPAPNEVQLQRIESVWGTRLALRHQLAAIGRDPNPAATARLEAQHDLVTRAIADAQAGGRGADILPPVGFGG